MTIDTLVAASVVLIVFLVTAVIPVLVVFVVPARFHRATDLVLVRWHPADGPPRDPERDAEFSARFVVPASETVTVPVFWVAQVFPPTLIPDLARALRPLAGFRPGRESPAEWLEGARRSIGGSWGRVGSIGRPQKRWPLADARSEDLPPEVDLVSIGMISTLPSAVVMTFEFWLSEWDAATPLRILNAETKSDGWLPPDVVKQRRISEWYSEVSRSMEKWVHQRFGGLFQVGDESRVVGRLVMTNKTEPLQRDTDAPFMGALGAGYSYPTWESRSLPGLRLTFPFGETAFLTSTSVRTFLPDDDMESWGGRNQRAIALRIADQMEFLLGALALDRTLVRLRTDLADLRDSAAADAARSRKSGGRLGALHGRALRLSTDILPLVGDLRRAEWQLGILLRDSPRFVTTDRDGKELGLFGDLHESLLREAEFLGESLTALERVISTGAAIIQSRDQNRLQWVLGAVALVTAILAAVQLTNG